MLRADVNEMNVQPVDLGNELREGVHFCIDLAPVILRRPIARECLNRSELHSLRFIRYRFPLRPLCCVDAPAQFGQVRLRNIHMKRANCISVSCWLTALWCSDGLGHGVILLSSIGFLWFGVAIVSAAMSASHQKG